MVKVIFEDVQDGVHESIVERFKSDYPNAEWVLDKENDLLIFTSPEDWVKETDVDTFLCEEIGHEYEVYSHIKSDELRMSYYYDEDDEWVFFQS